MNLIHTSQKLTVNQVNVKATVNGTGKTRENKSLHIPPEILIYCVCFKKEYYNSADRVRGWVCNTLCFKWVFPLPFFLFFLNKIGFLSDRSDWNWKRSAKRDSALLLQQRLQGFFFCLCGVFFFFFLIAGKSIRLGGLLEIMKSGQQQNCLFKGPLKVFTSGTCCGQQKVLV